MNRPLLACVLGCSVTLLTGCPPANNAQPVRPSVSWQMRDSTTGTTINVTPTGPGQYTAQVLGTDEFSASFDAQSNGGVGSISTDGHFDAVQCGTVTIETGGHPPTGPIQIVHRTGGVKNAAIDKFSYTATQSTVATSGFELYPFNSSTPSSGYDLQVCPTKTYVLNNLPGTNSAIVLNGTASAWGNSGLNASATLTIKLTGQYIK